MLGYNLRPVWLFVVGLLLGRKAMTNLDSVLKSTLPTKVCIVKAMVFL